MAPGLRKLALTMHVICSIGWFGAVAVFLALAIEGLTSPVDQIVRSVYLSMELGTRYVIVPLAFASLLTGVVSSLGTRWGLFRYYWVLVKLLITIVATIILLVHLQPISLLAGASTHATLFSADIGRVQIQMVIASGGTLLVLFVVTALSVYKPRGRTRYGWRKHYEKIAISRS